MTKQEQIWNAIAAQFANTLLACRMGIAADADLGPDAVSEAATERYLSLMRVASDAVSLWQKRTAKPGIPEDVLRQVNGVEKSVRIVPAQPKQTIDHDDVVRMADAIQTLICAASAASAEADGLCLHTLRMVNEDRCGLT